jgi:hypothetical protein
MADRVKDVLEEYGLKCNDVYWTGDAAGRDQNCGLDKAMSNWGFIKKHLRINDNMFKVPHSNPGITKSWQFVNTVIDKFDFRIDYSCKYTIQDLEFCLMKNDGEGDIKKLETGKNPFLDVSNEQLWHLLDTVRYGLHTTMVKVVYIHRS